MIRKSSKVPAVAALSMTLAAVALAQTDAAPLKITPNGSQVAVPGASDNFTGAVRIDMRFSAEAPARVSGGHAASVEKRLEPMVIAGSQTYGNYFLMTGTGPYQIELNVRVFGKTKPVRARFEWSRS